MTHRPLLSALLGCLALGSVAHAQTTPGQATVGTMCISAGAWVPCASGGAGSNAASGATGAAVGAEAGYTGINVAGTLRGWTGISIGSHYAGTVQILDNTGTAITSFGGGTQYTHDAALTVGSSIGTAAMGRASAAVPTDVSADGDAVLPWYLRSGAQATQVTFGGVLGAVGNGVSGTGVQRVTIASDSTGTIATTNAGTFAVQESGAALTALQLIDNLPVTIGSTTSGQSGALGMGAVTTAAPSYTTAQTAPLSLTTAGLLRVAIEAGAGSGGTAIADDADFTAGTTSFTPVGGLYQSSVTACTDTDACAAGITTGRALKVAISNADGSLATYATDMTVGSAFGTTGPGMLASYKEFDGSALPTTTNVGTEHEANPIATSLQGVQYVMVVSEDGALERGTTTTPMVAAPAAGTSAGADAYSHISVGVTEDEFAVKATAGTLYSITATNTNAAVRYLKCENDTAANTVPGSETPELRIAIPGAAAGAGFSTTFPVGYSFGTALTCWLVTGAADADATEVAANELMLFLTYK